MGDQTIASTLCACILTYIRRTYLVKVIATDNIYLSESKQSFPLISLSEESLIVICHYCVARALFFKWHRSINNRILHCLMSFYVRRWTTINTTWKETQIRFQHAFWEEGRFRFSQTHLTWIINKLLLKCIRNEIFIAMQVLMKWKFAIFALRTKSDALLMISLHTNLWSS